MDVSGRGEFAAIARLVAFLPQAPPGQVWIGDDAAVLAPIPGPVLVATDAVVAGVHADLALVGIDDLGWKALAASVSDLAAMGGAPLACVVSVSGPAVTDLDLLYRGLAEAAQRWGCPIVGGDLTAGPALTVTVTVLGDGGGAPPPVLRSGARPGDTVFVTGPLGSSAAGLRLLRSAGSDDNAAPLIDAHRRPLARLEEGAMARSAGATAMIDVSDGFAADMGHLLDASGVGARLSGIPIAPGATFDEAVGGGEDYELIFSASDANAVAAAFAAAGLRPPMAVGVCTAGGEQPTLDGSPLPKKGWEHPWS